MTTSQGGAILLPGVHVQLRDASSKKTVDETDSDGSGAFRFSRVAPGDYRLRASCPGFDDAESVSVRVRVGAKVSVSLDLPIAAISQSVIVRPRDSGSAVEVSPVDIPLQVAQTISLGVMTSGDLSGMLALRPGVILGQGGVISINGARSTQTHIEIDGASVIDPAVGGGDLGLPSEAIDSVEIMPNPTAVDSGRLTAGLIGIHTKPGPSRPLFSIANFIPEPRFRYNTIAGIRDFTPRLFVGAPLAHRRLFLAEGLVVGYEALRVPGLLNAKDTSTRYRLASFTRVDVPVSSSLLRVGTGVFASRTDELDLARFVPASTTANLRDRAYQVNASFLSTVGRVTAVESTVSVRIARVHINGTGTDDMSVGPDGRGGSYFNDQERDSSTVQWKELVSREVTGGHTVKAGFDMLRGAYVGTSASRPVDVVRLDGSLAKRIVFAGPSRQTAQGTDGALFVGDVWKPASRVRVESALRVELDRVFGSTHLAPRVTSAVGLKKDGSIAIRGGIGIFHERPPLAAVAFSSFEPFTVERFAADGRSLGPAQYFSEAINGPLQTPASTIWTLGYDHVVNPALSVSAMFLERRGSHELLVDPEEINSEAGRILLDSSGHSLYREMAVWAKFQRGTPQFSISYVRAAARGDLNSVDSLIGTLRDPFVRPNQYGPTSRDITNRVIGWLAVPFLWRSTLSMVGEWRTGARYSALDEMWDYVGARNGLRFPAYRNLHVNVARDVRLAGQKLRVYVRLYHALNPFNPVEVQNNITSPAFGTFYSSLTRRLAVDFDLIR